ncbi:hypothetical protein RIF25_12145 [Thermosynechococcaceae cyanobacterium BACA0444]|uniref:DUF2335 domain-containing protein n=1 Tax=Pseudocalidococcus azoricus BACA0444 TaxID=2918990 RepID=A0AAE4FSL0_9CYAN|nr:hypothetical protein [Pseudocalidococcus azoricus]MDS3861558.1 hypothetical protein [Pseudocalidococcus azoricus BACA0444]
MTNTPDDQPNQAEAITHTSPESSEEQNTVSITPEVLQILESKDISNRSIFVNPATIQGLIQQDPDALIKFAESSDERHYQLQLAVRQQKHKENLAKETRLILGGIFGLFTMCFIYAAFTKDQALPNQVFNVLLGGAGGAGLITTLNRKKD